MGGGASTEQYSLRLVDKTEPEDEILKPAEASCSISRRPSLQHSEVAITRTSSNTIDHSNDGSVRRTYINEKSSGSSIVRVSRKIPWIMKTGTFSQPRLNNFTLLRVLGRGLMGTVYLAKSLSTNVYVAIKSVKKSFVTKHHDERHIKNERDILSSLKSTFCLKLFGTFQDVTNLYFITEYLVGGELYRRLKNKGKFSPTVAKFYASEVFCALRYLHSLGLVFRDLKPENLMIDEFGHIKLIDFGFCTRPAKDGKLHTQVGTPAYLSPEQLNEKFTGGYTAIVDWWSFGVLLYELLTGVTPFCNDNRESPYEIYLRILQNRISFPMFFDNETKEMIMNLCNHDLSVRWVDPSVIGRCKYFTIDLTLVNNRKLVPPFVPSVTKEGDDSHFVKDTMGSIDLSNAVAGDELGSFGWF